MAVLMLMILHNCIMDPDLPRYYSGGSINWELVLSPWIRCSHFCMRLLARFSLSYVRCGLQDETLELLDMDTNDWNIFMKMLEECSQPPFSATLVIKFESVIQQIAKLATDFPELFSGDECNMKQVLPSCIESVTVEENHLVAKLDLDKSDEDFSCMIPASEVIGGLSNLVTRGKNLQLLSKSSCLQYLVALLTDGDIEDKITVCKLLLTLRLNSKFIQDELTYTNSTLFCLLTALHTHDAPELQKLSRCIMFGSKGNVGQLKSYTSIYCLR